MQNNNPPPAVEVKHYQPVSGASHLYGARAALSEAVRIMKGNCPGPDDRELPTDPGVIFIDVNPGATHVANFGQALQTIAPTRYALAKNNPGNPGMKFKMVVLFVTPITSVNDAVKMSTIPSDARAGLKVVEQYAIIRKRLVEASGDIDAVRRLYPNYKVVFNFTDSFQQIDDEDITVLKQGDQVFITHPNYSGEEGIYPRTAPEYQWKKTSRDIHLTPIHPGGVAKCVRNVTKALSRKYIPVGKSSIYAGHVMLPGKHVHGVTHQNIFAQPFTWALEPGFDGLCLEEWQPLVTGKMQEHVSSVFRGVVVEHEAMFVTDVTYVAEAGFNMTDSIDAMAKNLIHRIDVQQDMAKIADSLKSAVSSLQNHFSTQNPSVIDLRESVMRIFAEHVNCETAYRESLGQKVKIIRAARSELEIIRREGFFTRHAAASDGVVAKAFLEIRRALADGSPHC
jgi:hypothetical protein